MPNIMLLYLHFVSVNKRLILCTLRFFYSQENRKIKKIQKNRKIKKIAWRRRYGDCGDESSLGIATT